jgi:hypothetical protein
MGFREDAFIAEVIESVGYGGVPGDTIISMT